MNRWVAIDAPRFWWRASSDRVSCWVPEDPDVEDGHRRWDDRDAQRWPLIAAAVAAIGDALAAGDWACDDTDEPSAGIVYVDELSALTVNEYHIVRSWFRDAEAVRVDPWWDDLGNGRHRLWSTLPHFGNALVPINGDALGYANPSDTEVMGPEWASLFTDNLVELEECDWFDRNDPVNRRFIGALCEAANGLFPRRA